jgi:hypothetical protein
LGYQRVFALQVTSTVPSLLFPVAEILETDVVLRRREEA